VLQLKKDPDVAWFKAYKEVARAFCEFIKENELTVINYAGQEDPEAVFKELAGTHYKEKSGVAPTAAAATPTKQEETKVAAPKGGPAKKEEVKREPKKALERNTWYIVNILMTSYTDNRSTTGKI